MSYKITLEDDTTGDLISEVVDVDKRKDAVKTVNKKYGDKAVVIDIEPDIDDSMVYEKADDQYNVLIGGTDDK